MANPIPTRRPVFVLAPDSFKESLTASQVCAAMEAGLRASFPDGVFVHVPMADGGEGTMQSLVDATGGTIHALTVTGPLGEPVQASYGIAGDGTTGVVEMASASGLELTPPDRRDPRLTTTYGTGELVGACLDRGVTNLILGIGGSATNDAGAGFAEALGVRFLDADGAVLPRGGAALAGLAGVDVSGIDPRLAGVRIEVACDVDNPLCGPQGASAIYGPQKGADPATVAELDAALATFAAVVQRDLGREVASVPGAGAAGGLGAGLLAFTPATLRRGVEIVVDQVRLADHVAAADVILTGEGRLDGQTRFGKTPAGVAGVARELGKPVIAIAGALGDGVDDLDDLFAAVFPVIGRLGPLPEALAAGADNIERTCRNIGRTLLLGAGLGADTR